MHSLHDIFWNQLTHKSIKWSSYLDVYDQYFHKWRNTRPTFVEVGVYGGGSLEMWTKYFGPSAHIWGIDNDHRAATFDIPGTQVAIGDQGDPGFWQQFLSIVPKIDLFLDDGGHRMNQQITTFECVWPHISENGIYICEDTHTSYWQEFGAVDGEETFLTFAKRSVDILHRNHMRGPHRPNMHLLPLLRDLQSVSFFDSMVVFCKGRQAFDWCEVN
jgi:hypothetical protein